MTFHPFVVEGRGDFPIDMLRYDQCWPAHEVGSSDIRASLDSLVLKHMREVRRIKMKGLQEPTVGRWESFGWKVV